MTKQNGKTLVWSTAVLSLMLIATACSGGNNDSASKASPSAQATAPASPSATASPSASAGASPSVSTSEAKTANGEFQGVSDPHTIEIKFDGKTESFQMAPETMDKVSTWEPGTKVNFQYTETTQDVNGEHVKQLTITVIDKA